MGLLSRFVIISLLVIIPSILNGQSLFQESTETIDSSKRENHYDYGAKYKLSFYGPGERSDFNLLSTTLTLNGEYRNEQVKVFSELRLTNAWIYNEYKNEYQLKEAYLSFKKKRLNFKLGQQILKWGKMDAFSPLDFISPSDYFYLSSEADDAYLGNLMLMVTYDLDDRIQLQLLAIPAYKASKYRYDLILNDPNTSFTLAYNPELRIKNTATAARLNFMFNPLEVSFYSFLGFDPFSTYNIDQIIWNIATPEILLKIHPYKKFSLGTDLEYNLGSSILRSEIVWTHTRDFQDQMHIPAPMLLLALNLESVFWGFTSMLQYNGQFNFNLPDLDEPLISNPNDPNELLSYYTKMIYYNASLMNRKIFKQQEKLNHSLFLNIQKYFFYDKLDMTLSMYYNFTSDEYLFRPTFNYKFMDSINLSLGYNFLDGPEGEIYQLASNVLNNAFVEIKYQF